MNPWSYLLLAASICAAIYLLYRQGYVVTKSIAAVLFMLRPGRNSDKATLNSCNGWVRHRVRFRESGVYSFTFDSQLTGGDAEVLLLDKNHRQLLRLNRYLSAGQTEIDKTARYYLRWEFKSATGKCELNW